jgi:Ca-activated chloride channel homolog
MSTNRISQARCSFALLFLLLLPTPALVQQAAPPPSPQVPYTIKVNVAEVVLHATVRNHRGTPVAGLTQNDFQVLEDGAPQAIKHFSHEDIPVTVGLVIDNSGSMRPKHDEVVSSALAFASSSNPLDQMFLVNFNEHVSFGLPAGTLFTDKQDQLRDVMSTVKADGMTALYDAVIVALEHLKQGNRDKKVLIVVSDGGDNASKHTKAEVLDLAIRSNTIIYAIAIYEPDDSENGHPEVLKELARASGGEVYLPDSLRDIRPICERIAHEIRNQYTISYIPTNQKPDGTYRNIHVKATGGGGFWGGLTVITRAGYVAPSKPAVPIANASTPEAPN